MENQTELFPKPKKDKPAKKLRQKKDGSLYRNWGGFFPHPTLDAPLEAHDRAKDEAGDPYREDQAGDLPRADAGLPPEEPGRAPGLDAGAPVVDRGDEGVGG